MRTLNVRLAVILAVLSLVFIVGVYFLHGYQLHRNASVFKRESERDKTRAEEAANDKDEDAQKKAIKDSIKNLTWYVRFRPDDIDTVEQLGVMMADNADSARMYAQAFGLLERVLRTEPDRKNVRSRLVDMAMMAQRFPDAKEHLEQYLLKQSPEDPLLWDKLGQCYMNTGEYDIALDNFKKAIELDPAQSQSYSRLAMLLRQHFSRVDEADLWMEKLVATNPKSAQAHFLRGTYLKNFNMNDEAYKEALASLELEPDNRDALWLASQCCITNRDFDKAREYATHSIKLYPKNIIMYSTLADAELQAGKPDKALEAMHEGLDATSRHPQLLWGLANVQIDAKKPEEAEKTIAELRKAEFSPQLVEYLVARKNFSQGKWLVAREGFEKVRGSLIQYSDLLKQVDIWIGQCYGNLGNREGQELAYQRALKLDPFYAPARAGLMEVSRATGDVDTALKEYDQLAKLGKLSTSSLIPYAEMLITQISREPSSQQDWTKVIQVLNDAEKANPDAIQIPILRAKILIAQDRLEDAEKLLEHARRKNPGHSNLWTVLATLAERRKDWDKAERLLTEAQQKWGDTVSQRLATAELLSQRHGKNSSDRIRKLGEHIDQFSETDRLQLWGGLVNIALQVDDKEFVKQLMDKIAEKQPNNIQVRFFLFEQAVNAEDLAAVESALLEIERVAGQGAYWNYGQAVRLVLQAKKLNDAEQDPLLEKALEYLAKARELRQNWSRIPLLTAGIYSQQGKIDDALKSYLEAIDQGERDPNAVQQTVQLLFQKQRYNEADRLLRKLKEQKVSFTADMSRASTEAALRQGDFNHALEMARKTVPADSKRYQDHLWLGQILAMIARQAKTDGYIAKSEDLMAEAAKSLQRAVEIEPKIPATWIALVQFLNTANKEDQAEKVIEEAGKNIPAKEAPLAIGQCYEVLGKSEAAEAKYDAAMAASPEDPQVLRAVADFYCRTGKLAPAESLLRRIVDGKVQAKDEDVTWARRQLAMVFTSRGGYRNAQKARELIEQNLAAKETSVLDRRAKASIDALDPDRTRRDEALRELESLEQDESASTEDRFQLAQMYRAAGAWTQANRTFRKLVASSGNDPRYLSAYIAALLEHNETSTAETYLNQLEKIIANHVATVGLRAEVLVAKNEPEKALEALSGFIDRPNARPTERDVRIRLAADKLEQLARKLSKPGQKAIADRFVQKAESLYREYVEINPAQNFLLLAFLARNGRTDQALDMMQQTWNGMNPAVVSNLCNVFLQNDKIGKEQMQRLNGILQSALKQFNRPIPLLMIEAELCTKQARYADAEACYREVVQKSAGNAYAMNNLAVLLSLQHIKLDESLKLIDQAVAIAGPMGAMLDSRAVIYLALGDAEKALADMADAVADAETPVRLFHQAQAYQLAGRSVEAAGALDKALQKGLTPQMLHPLEVPAFEKLKDSVK